MYSSDHQKAWLAHSLTLAGKAEESMTQTIANSKVDMNPHQVEAALFALSSPLSSGLFWLMKLDWEKLSKLAWSLLRNGQSESESYY